MIAVAATDPVSDALPIAVTHNPTTRALALAARVRVNFVVADVFTICAVGTTGVVEPPCGRMLSTVKLVPLTAVTLPKAPNPPNPLPPNPLPPPLVPRVRPGFGVPEDGVGPPAAPGDRTPAVRSPPRAEQVPFTAGEISTEAATIGPLMAFGSAVGRGPPVPDAGMAVRAWTQAPTRTSERRAPTVLVKVVAAE